MSAPVDRIARFSLIDGEMILHSRDGDWVFYQDHLAALAAARAEGLRMALDAIPSGWMGAQHQSNMDYGPNVALKARTAIKDMLTALLPPEPQP